MAETVLKQSVIMLILILTGVLCAKTKLISAETNKEMSKFVLQIVNPVVILMSYQIDYRPELMKNLLLTFLLSGVSFVIAITSVYILIRKKEGRKTEIERFSAIYSNCGFIGIPLVNALFGNEGVFYLTAYITVFNLLAWTHGVMLISGRRDLKSAVRSIFSPTVIAIFAGLITYFFRIKIPSVPAQALNLIASLNTPLAMIVSGVAISDANFSEIARNPRIFYVDAVKLIIIPLMLLVVFAFVPAEQKVKMTVFVAASAPPATMCTLQCLRYGKDSGYSSEIFATGTLISIITLPVLVKIAEYIS